MADGQAKECSVLSRFGSPLSSPQLTFMGALNLRREFQKEEGIQRHYFSATQILLSVSRLTSLLLAPSFTLDNMEESG
jgi:hypothetical protein